MLNKDSKKYYLTKSGHYWKNAMIKWCNSRGAICVPRNRSSLPLLQSVCKFCTLAISAFTTGCTYPLIFIGRNINLDFI